MQAIMWDEGEYFEAKKFEREIKKGYDNMGYQYEMKDIQMFPPHPRIPRL